MTWPDGRRVAWYGYGSEKLRDLADQENERERADARARRASVEHRAAHEDRPSCVTRAALAPTLTPLDERVLRALSKDRGRRLHEITTDAYAWTRLVVPYQQRTAEVRGILRGLEHLGRATGRGGWWRAL